MDIYGHSQQGKRKKRKKMETHLTYGETPLILKTVETCADQEDDHYEDIREKMVRLGGPEAPCGAAESYTADT